MLGGPRPMGGPYRKKNPLEGGSVSKMQTTGRTIAGPIDALEFAKTKPNVA